MNNNPRKTPILPQDDSASGQEQREIQLAHAKTEYIWNYEVPSVKGVPMSKEVPESNKPTLAWFVEVIEVAVQIVENTLANAIEGDEDKSFDEIKSVRDKLLSIKDEHKTHESKSIGGWVHDLLHEAKQLITISLGGASEELLKLKQLVDQHSEKLSSASDEEANLDAYKDLFKTIKLSPQAEQFQSDSMFAHYRVAGPNPMLISNISVIPANFPVTDEAYQAYMGSEDSLAQALADKRLFILDYKELQTLSEHCGNYDGIAKQLFVPMVLLARPKDADILAPVAIQRSQNPDDSTIVYATEDSSTSNFWHWQTAKSIVEMAEGNYHELFVHLARTHLFVEPFAVATQRNLAEVHPLNILLTPHFEGTLFINNAAAGSLIAEGGPIDQIFAGEITYTQQVAGNDRLAYDFYANMLPTDLANRGVADSAVLPNYPYRDDALLIWSAIEKWITEYVNIYYPHDNAVLGDTELAAWTADITEQGKIKGFKAITGKDQLVQVLTMIIFTGSAQHAAVNFPQSEIMTYAPAISGTIWGEKNPKGDNKEQWKATLAPMQLASKQLNLLHLLGGVYYRMLGNYQTNDFPYLDWFEDSQISGKGAALERFQQALKQVESKIESRNKKRAIPYTHLLPSKIPMSINI
ncbi:MAG: lipoxygenase [Pseudomonadales bacterium]|nr:lipoxygenase [Pseudomonadales bacterium]